MNNPSKVYDFLTKNSNKWFCDDCIEKRTGVDRHEVNTVGWTLALFPREFARTSAACSQNCSTRQKMATQATRYQSEDSYRRTDHA
jgi:hypothetical protein